MGFACCALVTNRDGMSITPERGQRPLTFLDSSRMSFLVGRRSMTRKKQRGPRAASERAPIGALLPAGLLARVDRWAASQKDDPSPPEALQRLVELGLASTERAGARTKTAAKASDNSESGNRPLG